MHGRRWWNSLPRSNRTRKTFLALAILVLFPMQTSFAWQEQPQEPELFLKKHLAFSHDQILQVRHGATVAKMLEPEGNEVAVAGVVRMNVPEEFFIAKVRDIERHKKVEAVLQVKKFSDPVQPDDLRDLALLPQEVADLKDCRPTRCNFKLSREEIERIHRQVHWDAPDAAEQATAAFRQILIDYVRGYLAKGNRAMIDYDDKDEPLETASAFEELLKQSQYLADYVPEFRQYLHDFPEAALPGVENFLYWSRERYSNRLKPAITITQVSIYRRSGGAGPTVLMASKQIYASHYFEGSLGLTIIFPAAPADPAPSFYLIYLNRSRIDLLRKWYSGLVRGSLSDRVRNSMRVSVIETRQKVEAEYAANRPANRIAPESVHREKMRGRR